MARSCGPNPLRQQVVGSTPTVTTIQIFKKMNISDKELEEMMEIFEHLGKFIIVWVIPILSLILLLGILLGMVNFSADVMAVFAMSPILPIIYWYFHESPKD